MLSTSPALLEVFRMTYFKTAQQKKSVFEQSGILEWDGRNGAIHNFERVMPIDVAPITTKNQAATQTPWTVDNRQWYTTVYFAELMLDKEIDIEKAISDPKSALMENAVAAGNRQIDRACAAAATADVSSGAPEQAKTALTFAADGGLSIDATGGITEDLLRTIKQRFLNGTTGNSIDDEEIQNAVFFGTGSEEKQLLSLEKLVNRLYSTFTDENKVHCRKILDTYKAYFVPGSDSIANVANPVLAENGATRTCLVIAPRGLVAKINVKDVEIFEKLEGYVNSQKFRFKIEIGACRTEGQRVIAFDTTIES